MRSLLVFVVAFICVTARVPFLSSLIQPLEVSEDNRNYYQGQINETCIYPFQSTIIMQPSDEFQGMRVYYNESILTISGQFLELSVEGEMVPNFNKPLNGTVVTARLHTMSCYPSQGGNYYRNDDSLPYGETENEIVGSRATDEQGYLSLTVSRSWMTRINDAKSIVLNTANNGIILCSNINWVEVDGSLTSTVSIVSFVAALGFAEIKYAYEADIDL